ncbi:MAG: FHA domain-containing protein, partial [Opitutaceae bacterium]
REGHPSAVAGSTMMMPSISGCLRLRPQGEDLLPNQAVWIFTDAMIGAEAACAITLPQAKLSPEHARIHYWKKSFWIEALRSGSTVVLGGKPLLPGASEGLSSGQELRLGDCYYKVHLS